MSRALLGLAFGAFAIGTTELGVVGMLPEITRELGVAPSSAGLLVSAYAIGVVVGAPTLTTWGIRHSPRRTLTALLGLLVLGNVLASLAPGFLLLAAARACTGLAHGAFFGVGSVVARASVPPHRGTRAVAVLFAGIASASILGVPAGAFLAQQWSWRVVFVLCAVLGLLAAAGLTAWLPDSSGEPVRLRAEATAFRRPQVWLLLAVTMIGLAATYSVYANITLVLTDLGHVPTRWLTAVLVLFGLGTTVGTLLGGRLGDRFGMAVVATGLPALVVVLVLTASSARGPTSMVLSVVAIGALAFAMNPVMQAQVIGAARVAGGSLVSAANQGAFNVANATGPAVATAALATGHGPSAVLWVAAGFAAAGTVLAGTAWWVDRRSPWSSAISTTPLAGTDAWMGAAAAGAHRGDHPASAHGGGRTTS